LLIHTVGGQRTVKLKMPLPVYITYLTARVSPDGLVQFRKDLYDVDSAQTRRLAQRLDRLRKTAQAAASAALPRKGSGGSAGQ
jgi:murein L,D-transpeptidase YcbB/YkuD